VSGFPTLHTCLHTGIQLDFSPPAALSNQGLENKEKKKKDDVDTVIKVQRLAPFFFSSSKKPNHVYPFTKYLIVKERTPYLIRVLIYLRACYLSLENARGMHD
jgi:hypothetical protein